MQDDEIFSHSLEVKHELETRLIEKCWRDPDFQKLVVADPKKMLETFLGQRLPDRFRIFVHEDDQDTMHLTIPPVPSNRTELSDEELERIAGGTEFAVGVTILAAATAASFSMEALSPEVEKGSW
jgi:Nitrile hydratase, alpha chain